MKRLLEGLQLLLLGVWVGGMIGFGAFVAPRLFSLVPSRQLAGIVAGGVIDTLSLFGVIGLGMILILQWLSGRRWDWRMTVLVAVVALNGLNATYVRGGLDRAQAEMPLPIEQYAVTDPLRVEYNRWHRMSNNVGMAAVLLGTAVLVGWPFGREPRAR